MESFEATTTLPYPAREVFAWHARPGALTRISPPWVMRVLSEAHPPLAPGTIARLRTAAGTGDQDVVVMEERLGGHARVPDKKL